MTKQYTDTNTGKTFNTKQEAINYYVKHVLKQEEGSKASEIIESFKKFFNNKVNVTVKQNTDDSTKSPFVVDISSTDNDKLKTWFGIGGDDQEINFDSLEDALEFFKQYKTAEEKVVKLLDENYSFDKYNNPLKNLRWNVISDCDSSDLNEITFTVNINDTEIQEKWIIGETEDSFLKHIASYFSNEIEGDVHVEYDGMTFVDYTDLSTFLKRAKKARVTILE